MKPQKKYYYVPWEGYQKGSQPDGRGECDRLCLQGPHTLDAARSLATELRSFGLLASVIDCSETLSNSEEMYAMLQRAAKFLMNAKNETPECALYIEIEKLLNKIDGKGL